MASYLLIAAAILMIYNCSAFPKFKQNIPNAEFVINPISKKTHDGVGHFEENGKGPRNCFGKDFKRSDMSWRMLCGKDSDGDGKTNGEELGDPKCEWVMGTDIAANDVTHPGVCTPVDEPLCVYMNALNSDCDVSNFKPNSTGGGGPTSTMMTSTTKTSTMKTTTSSAPRSVCCCAIMLGILSLVVAVFQNRNQ